MQMLLTCHVTQVTVVSLQSTLKRLPHPAFLYVVHVKYGTGGEYLYEHQKRFMFRTMQFFFHLCVMVRLRLMN